MIQPQNKFNYATISGCQYLCFIITLFLQIGFKVYRVDSTTEELNAPYFSYKRNDGGHKCLAKTPTWQGEFETLAGITLIDI